MNWTITDLQSFQSKVLTEKENFIGEKITDKYTFAGAGEKCIKLESKNNIEFISYEDVLNEEDGNAKALFNFFFKEIKEDNSFPSDDSFSVDFKVQWNQNPQVYFEGYVNIPGAECEDEEIEWYYYDANGFASSQKFIEHEGVDIKGATTEQKWEIEQFKNDFLEESFWIEEWICQSDADENSVLVVKNCTVIIGEGA